MEKETVLRKITETVAHKSDLSHLWCYLNDSDMSQKKVSALTDGQRDNYGHVTQTPKKCHAVMQQWSVLYLSGLLQNVAHILLRHRAVFLCLAHADSRVTEMETYSFNRGRTPALNFASTTGSYVRIPTVRRHQRTPAR